MPFTDEQKAELNEILKGSLGEILAPALKDIETKFGKMANGAAMTAAEKAVKGFKEKLDAVPTAEALEEKLAARLEELKQTVVPQGGKPAGGVAASPDVEALKKQIADMQTAMQLSDKKRNTFETELAKERAARAEDLAKQKRTEERSLLSVALEKAGVTNPTHRAAATALLIDRGVIKRNDEGEVVLEYKDIEHASTELLPIEKGVATWAGTEEGKTFLPPKDSGGSGERGAGRNVAAGKNQFALNKEKIMAGLRGG